MATLSPDDLAEMLMQVAHAIDMINHLPDPGSWTDEQLDEFPISVDELRLLKHAATSTVSTPRPSSSPGNRREAISLSGERRRASTSPTSLRADCRIPYGRSRRASGSMLLWPSTPKRIGSPGNWRRTSAPRTWAGQWPATSLASGSGEVSRVDPLDARGRPLVAPCATSQSVPLPDHGP